MTDTKAKSASKPKGKEATPLAKGKDAKAPGKNVKPNEDKKKVAKPRRVHPIYQLPSGEYKLSARLLGSNKYLAKPECDTSLKGLKCRLKKKPKLQLIKKKVEGEKKKRRVKRPGVKKLPKYYPAADALRKRKHKKKRVIKTKPLRASLKPGTILILVAGRHRGKRVVFLKGLRSGLLLVTGPYKLNACPLRRINQQYVIATKTRLDISKVEIPTRIRDVYFKRRHPRRPRKDEGEIFETQKETYKLSDKRKADQIKVDKQIFNVIKNHEDKNVMLKLLAAPFSLSNRVFPHKLVF